MNEAAAFFLDSASGRRMGAYLIVCPRPDVAKSLADEFLMRLYCKSGGCGACADCRKVREGHVDVRRLSAPRVDDFREVIAFVAQQPYEGVCRAVVIENADGMTDAAGNSMLKTLEEPPENAVILLLARSAAGVLPTIASRCTAVIIAPERSAAVRIATELNVDGDTARVLCDLSGGFFEEARRIYEDKALLALRSGAIDICVRLMDQKGDAVSAHADFLEANKENIIPLLCAMQSFFRDVLIVQKTGNEGLIVNRDRAADILRISSGFTTGAVYNMMNVILETERRLAFALNFRLAAECMLFDMLEEKNRWKR